MPKEELEPIRQRVHRNTASHNCAYAYNTFLMIDEPAELLEESKKDGPGLLVTDPAGVISLLFLKEGLPTVLRTIQQLGLDPVGCGYILKKENIVAADQAVERIQAGLTYVNSSTIGSEVHLPFGGVKATGHGREAGIEGLNEFSETKTVYIDYSGRLQKAQIDPVR